MQASLFILLTAIIEGDGTVSKQGTSSIRSDKNRLKLKDQYVELITLLGWNSHVIYEKDSICISI